MPHLSDSIDQVFRNKWIQDQTNWEAVAKAQADAAREACALAEGDPVLKQALDACEARLLAVKTSKEFKERKDELIQEMAVLACPSSLEARAAWLQEKSRLRVTLCTHTVKHTHPSANGRLALVTTPDDAPGKVSTANLLDQGLSLDATCSASAMGFQTWLETKVDGKSLRTHLKEGHPDIMAELALHEDPEERPGALLSRILGENNPPPEPFVSVDVKQVYVPSKDGQDILLVIQYPSSALQHYRDAVWKRINPGMSKKEKPTVGSTYSRFPGVKKIDFGGSKPQNISRLTSSCGRDVPLLASVPPQMTARNPIFRKGSFFGAPLARLVSAHLESFSKILQRQGAPRRLQRAALERVMDSVQDIAYDAQLQDPGWSQTLGLDYCEALWLDPQREDEDGIFQALASRPSSWSDDVAVRFAHWLGHEVKRLGHEAPAHQYDTWATAFRQKIENYG